MRFVNAQGTVTREAVLRHGMNDWFYSLGKQNPGAITLRNYPESLLREFRAHDGRGARPRDARHRPRPRARHPRVQPVPRTVPHEPDDLVRGNGGPATRGPDRADRDSEATLRRRHRRHQSPRSDGRAVRRGAPPGFGFSDTAFRVFILMASRRLKSDRFFTYDYRPEVYTPFGIDWLNEQSMQLILGTPLPAR